MNALRSMSLCLSACLFVGSLQAADPKAPMVNNLPFNTEFDEDDPHVSSDGRFLYYSSNAKGNWDIWYSARTAPGQPWRKGVIFDDYLQSKDDERSVFVMPEGRYPQYMFACTKKTKDIDKPNWDIYVAVKQNARAAFAAPTPLNTIDTEADEMHPWLTADARRLFFSRKDKDGWRVFVASRQATTGAAGFGQPAMLKDLPVGFHHPTLNPAATTMYLQGPMENDRTGLFVSTLNGAKWSEPLPLNINSAEGATGDSSPCLSRDGKILYFSSDRPGGKGKKDVYAVNVDQVKAAMKDK